MKANRKIMTNKRGRLAGLCFVAVIAALVSFGLSGCSGKSGADSENTEESTIYACPMLCVPPQDKPGKCSVCGMELLSVDDTGKANDPVIAMSERSRALSQIQTKEVATGKAEAEIRVTGKVTVDETRMFDLAARIAGRIDELFADFTGKQVKKGDVLASIYSPELISAQEELSQAVKSGDKQIIEASRQKLALLGITDEQIDNAAKGKAETHMRITSPVDGAILVKNVTEGAYVKTGDRLYSIADLTSVWVDLDVYESDLGMVREGQRVTLRVKAYPNSDSEGTVTFIDPALNMKTRSIKVRVDVPNKDLLLKPGMFAQAVLRAELDADGKPVEPGRSYAKPLLVPATAPLITGTRAVVYVQTENEGEYAGRNIKLGPRAGDKYVVLDGLSEGDMVVTHGNFRIDSAMQIMGKPSMMMQENDTEKTVSTQRSAGTPQTMCPVMGNPVNKDVYVDYKGHRVYFCCAGCDGTFLDDPDKFIKEMQDKGIVLDKTPSEGAAPEKDADEEIVRVVPGPQTKCPMMGTPIDKDSFLDHGGYRIYFCCMGCAKAFAIKADELTDKLLKDGIVLEKTPKE